MRVGIVGCGLIGRRRAEIVRASAGETLVIVADTDLARAQEVASLSGCEAASRWEEVVSRKDIDIVVVATTNNWLAPITIAALENKKHVLCEKPLGRNATESSRMLEAARSRGCRLKTGFNHRHHPAVWRAFAMFREGAIGDILFIRCRYGHGGRPGYEKEWRMNPAISGGGELLDQGIHAIDLCGWFLGPFVEAFGFAHPYFWNPGGACSSPVEDNAFCLLRTTRGQVASIHASWTQWKNIFSLEVFGRDGYLSVEGLGGSYGPERLIWGRRRPEGGAPEEQRFDFAGPDISWEAEWQEFVNAIRENREPVGNGQDGWRAMKLVEAIYESQRTASVVRLGGRPEYPPRAGRGRGARSRKLV